MLYNSAMVFAIGVPVMKVTPRPPFFSMSQRVRRCHIGGAVAPASRRTFKLTALGVDG